MFQTANQIEYYNGLFPCSCPTPTAATVEQVQWAVVRCCKYLVWMIYLGACIRFFMAPVIFCAYFILTYAVKIYQFVNQILHKMGLESCGWLQLRDSIQFAQKHAKLDFNPKQLVCKYPKPYFRVIPLFPWILTVYNVCKYYVYNNIIYNIHVYDMYVYLDIINTYTHIYIHICIYHYIPVYIDPKMSYIIIHLNSNWWMSVEYVHLQLVLHVGVLDMQKKNVCFSFINKSLDKDTHW